MPTETVSANPRLVDFSQDIYRFTVPLREAGLDAASKIAGDKDKLRVYIQCLDTLRGHAVARFKEQTKDKVAMLEQITQRAQREQAQETDRRAKQIENLKAQLATLEQEGSA